MLRSFAVLVFVFTLFAFTTPAFSIEKPTPPPAPSAPNSVPSEPEAPAPPETSGVYDVPNHPELKVRVFAHPPRPTAPPNPARNPSPTPASSESQVCGLSDPPSNSETAQTGWHLATGTVTYRLNPSSVPSSVGGSNLNNIVTPGFGQYTLATGGKVNFVNGLPTSVNRSRYDGQNVIAWNRLSSGTLGVTYTWYWPSTGLVAETDTIMNNRYKWSWSGGSNTCADPASYDAQDIMTHELGHWLGLDDMYNSATHGDNTMFGYGSTGEVKKNTLTAGDIAGVVQIYP